LSVLWLVLLPWKDDGVVVALCGELLLLGGDTQFEVMRVSSSTAVAFHGSLIGSLSGSSETASISTTSVCSTLTTSSAIAAAGSIVVGVGVRLVLVGLGHVLNGLGSLGVSVLWMRVMGYLGSPHSVRVRNVHLNILIDLT
jgi:hypothetical protein